MSVKEISDIVSDLMKVGAMIPDTAKCQDLNDDLMDIFSDSRTMAGAMNLWSATGKNPVKNWDLARLNGYVNTIAKYRDEELIPKDEVETLHNRLASAVTAVEKDEPNKAAEELNMAYMILVRKIPQWAARCACVKKGDIIASIYDTISRAHFLKQVDKAAIWTNMMSKLADDKIITHAESGELIISAADLWPE